MKTKITTTIFAGVIIMMFFQSTSLCAKEDNKDLQTEKQKSFQTENGRFPSKIYSKNIPVSQYASTIMAFLFKDNNRTPISPLPVCPVDLTRFNETGNNQLNVTWLGHSSLMINVDGYKILTDPVFEKRISIFGPTRFNGNVPIGVAQIPDADVVIISHDHYDHLNRFSIEQLKDKAALFIVPLSVGKRLLNWGVPEGKIRELDWWEEFHLDRNLMIAATPSQHFSGRGVFDRNKTLWASWVISGPFHKLFFSGDSGYFDGFKQIGDAYGPFDMTFMECGAYNEAWSPVHMFPEQTVQAHLDLKGNILHPIHWGTFNLSLHPWYDPMERLTKAAKAKNVQISTPIVGDTTVYNTTIHSAKWWRQPMAQQTITR